MPCMRALSTVCAVMAVALPLRAASFGQAGPFYKGRGEFVFVGASMTDNEGLDNGVNCLKSTASATVFASVLPARPRLISASLFIGGSLIEDPGNDGIFTPPPGLSADNAADVPLLEAAARDAADKSVEFLPPGATSPITVTGTTDPYVSVIYKSGGTEQGNLGFFVLPIDVTDVIKNQGNGVLAGTYTVSGLTADVCYGVEVACDPTGATSPSCATTVGSSIHTNGAASWALMLVVEDPSLPLRIITTYEGLIPLAGTSTTQMLQLTSPISDPASGSLAFYALEGDMLLPNTANNTGPCAADEYIEVDGDNSPLVGGKCLVDDDNPQQNIFNGTINVQPAIADPDTCGDWKCCLGDGLCRVVGVDIDRFNISDALEPGADQVRVTVRSGQDRIFLATVVLGIDVFQPILDIDTQIRVINADALGYVQLGTPVEYTIAVSNTGNEPAPDVQVHMDMPSGVSGLTVDAARLPAGAVDTSSPTGGANGTGFIHVEGFTVPAGEIAEIRFSVMAPCNVGRLLTAHATVQGTGVPAFDVEAPRVTLRGPGLATCAGLETNGPFAPPEAHRVLRGGGCSAVGGGALASILLAIAAWRRPRRRK